MDQKKLNEALPSIPAKRYFTIGEVSELCLVKPHVLRYWEQEFTQLKPVKRRNRRYYQHQEVILIRRIRELLYDHGLKISSARNYLISERDMTAAPMATGLPFLSGVALTTVKQEIQDILMILRGR